MGAPKNNVNAVKHGKYSTRDILICATCAAQKRCDKFNPEALYNQILIAYGWKKEIVDPYEKSEGYGLIYHLHYGESEEVAEASAQVSLQEMKIRLLDLEEKYPNSYWVIPANFIVAQAYWLVSMIAPYAASLSAKEKAVEYFQRVLELTNDNEFNLYRQIAQTRLDYIDILKKWSKRQIRESQDANNNISQTRKYITKSMYNQIYTEMDIEVVTILYFVFNFGWCILFQKHREE